MKKIIIVSTKVDGGKGGISSALYGYISGLNARGIEYELIESHNQNNTLVAWFLAFIKTAVLAMKYRKNAVFWFHGAQWLSIFRKCTLAIFPFLCGADTLFHIHSPAYKDYIERSKSSRLLTKLALAPFRKVVVLTPWWKELLLKSNVSLPIIVSPNPNDIEYCEIAQTMLNKNNAPEKEVNAPTHILTMARMVDGKGVDLVIRALSQLSENYFLTVAGDGPLLSKYKQLVEDLGLGGRVSFTGWISGEDKEALLRNSDLFCLPSTYDSFGMVFIEAMAFDLPVIAYSWGPIADVVTEDVGLCCEVASVDEVIKSITSITSKLSCYSGNGPRRVLSNYTPQKIVDTFISNIGIE